MRVVADSPQNAANTMRDLTRAASPQTEELEKQDQLVKKLQGSLERAQAAAKGPVKVEWLEHISATDKDKPDWKAQFGGLNPAPNAGPNTEDIQKASAALNEARVRQRQLREEITATNPAQLAEVEILKAKVAGQHDSVREAQMLLDADKVTAAKPQSDASRQVINKKVAEDEIALTKAQDAVKDSSAKLDVARAGNSLEKKHAAQLAENQLAIDGAENDKAAMNIALTRRTEIENAHNQQLRADAASLIDEQIAKEKTASEIKLSGYADDVRMHRRSAREGADAEIAEIKRIAAALIALNEQKRALPNTSAPETRTINTAEVAITDNAAKQIEKAQRAAADATLKMWQSTASQIESAFNSQLRGLLQGTTSWAQAGKNILLDYVVTAIQAFEKLALNFILAQTTMTTAETGGSAMRLAAEQTASSGGLAALIANAIKSITSSAATAGAGATANAAPFLGPAALGVGAGVEAATLAMGLGGIGSMDIGAFNVPRNQLAMIHQNELVMPAPEAGAFRSMLGDAAAGGGSGGRNVSAAAHFHISAIDGADVVSKLKWNRSEMANAMRDMVKSGVLHGVT